MGTSAPKPAQISLGCLLTLERRRAGCAMFMFLSSSQPSLTKQITEYVFGKLRLTLLSPFSYTVGSLLNFTERVGWKERGE